MYQRDKDLCFTGVSMLREGRASQQAGGIHSTAHTGVRCFDKLYWHPLAPRHMHKPLVTSHHITYMPRRCGRPITAPRTCGMCWLRVVERKFVPFTLRLQQGLSHWSEPTA